MYRAPSNPGEPALIEEPKWGSITVTYAMMASVPLLLWIVTQPQAGIVTLASIAGLFVGGRHAFRLTRCFYDCGGFTFDLGETVQISVAQISAEEAC